MWETDHRVPEETQASAAGQDDAVTRQSRFRSKRPQLTRSSFFYGTFLNERWQEIASRGIMVFQRNSATKSREITSGLAVTQEESAAPSFPEAKLKLQLSF